MKREAIWIGTGKPVDPGSTITIDHVTDKIEIVVKSLSGVTAKDIANLIQTKHEVIKCNHIDSKVFAK